MTDTLAFTCLHRPDCGVDWNRLIYLSEKTNNKHPNSADYRETLGAALCRQGRYRESIDQLTEAVRLGKRGGSMWTQFFLAMAYQRSSSLAQAREWLAKAVGQDYSRAARLKGVEPYSIKRSSGTRRCKQRRNR